MTDDTGVALSQRALFGMVGLSTSSSPVNGAFHVAESLLGVAFPIAGVFYSFDTTWTTHAPELADFSGVTGRKLHVCWQPSRVGSAVLLTDIAAGVYDAHIDQMLAGMAAYTNGEVICRWGHEMNGNFNVWSAAWTGANAGCTDPSQYIAAWRYVVTKGRAQAPNVKWFFCANGGDVGAFPMESYYPGDSYVDIIGFDAYNTYSSWGTPFQTWQSPYDRVAAMHPTAPVWIGETGCKEDPAGDVNRKAVWAGQMLAETHMSRIKAVNYFDTVGGFDWRYQTSSISLAAFTSAYQSMINPTALADGHGVLPISAEPPPAFVPDGLPLASGSKGWTAFDSHARHHSNIGYWFNQIAVNAGGYAALLGKTTGALPAAVAEATAISSAVVPIMRLALDVAGTKRALETRITGEANAKWTVGIDGSQGWGPGGATPVDTKMYRESAGVIATDGIVHLNTLVAAPTSNPTGGALLYVENGAVKARVPSAGTVTMSRRLWQDFYSSASVFNGDPMMASSAAQPAGGIVHLALVYLDQTKTISNILLNLTVAGSGFTAGSSFAAVFDLTGVQLGVTGDLATVWATAGVRSAPLVTPAANVPSGKVVVAILMNATTLPTVSTFASPGTWNLTGINQRFVRAGGTGLTAMPSSINVSGLSATAPTPYLVSLT